MSSERTRQQTARELRDPKAMRALAHPLRLKIRELLERGPMTATQLSEVIGESPANCSFHLRTLAKYGFVEEAGGGAGRSRPWQLVSESLFIEPEELEGEAKVAADALLGLMDEVRAERAARDRAVARALPKAWQEALFTSEWSGPRVTPAELRQIHEGFAAVVAPYLERSEEDRPKNARRVRLTASGIPIDAAP